MSFFARFDCGYYHDDDVPSDRHCPDPSQHDDGTETDDGAEAADSGLPTSDPMHGGARTVGAVANHRSAPPVPSSPAPGPLGPPPVDVAHLTARDEALIATTTAQWPAPSSAAPLDLDVIRARWNDPNELPHPNQAEVDVAALIAAVRYERSEVERRRAAWRSLSDLRWQLAEERDRAERERDEARALGGVVLALCDGAMPSSPYTLAAEIRAALATSEDGEES